MALAAIGIAMERIDEATLPTSQRQEFLFNVRAFTGLESTSQEVIRSAEELRISLDNNVNLQELMRTIDAQCHRGNPTSSSPPKDTDDLTSVPDSPREVVTQHL